MEEKHKGCKYWGKAHHVSLVWIHCNALEEGEKIEGRRRSRSERKSLAEC